MISRQFFKSSLIYSVTGALPLAASVLLLPFYTNLLSTGDFGRLALFISFSFLMQILVSFGLDSYITVQYIEYRNDSGLLKQNMSGILTAFLGFSGGIVLLSMLIGPWLFRLIFHDAELAFYPYGFLSVLTAVFHGIFKLYTNLLIYQQQPVRYFWVNILNFILVVALSLSGLYLFPRSLIGPMWGRLLAALAMAALAFIIFLREFGLTRDRSFLRGMAGYCWPLVLYSLLFWILSYVDRFIINHYLQAESVAIYDFAVKCTLLIEFFQNGLVSTIYPKVFGIWKEQPDGASHIQVNRYFSAFSAATLLILPLFLIAVPALVPLVVKREAYYSAFHFLPILSLGFVARSLFYMFLAPFYYYRKTRLLPRVLFFSSLLQLLFSFWFVKEWGVLGAVWVNFGMKWIVAGFAWNECRKIYNFKFNRLKLLWLPVIYTLIFFLADLYVTPATPLLVHTLEGVISLFLVFFVYRRELLPIWNQWRTKKAPAL
ncbi:MAG TPA: oligosaccharide flippase family protein [bacterium]|nr:oligosaccharide flippase family protein [bacterium]HQG45554.1 oligosaccharide flippase family protein [bacterium]HQI49429.1 oligosaccharide flippase family protein [bacterium]HQJ65294.1 oligosaccharide flippase family protein [bacterium]